MTQQINICHTFFCLIPKNGLPEQFEIVPEISAETIHQRTQTIEHGFWPKMDLNDELNRHTYTA